MDWFGTAPCTSMGLSSLWDQMKPILRRMSAQLQAAKAGNLTTESRRNKEFMKGMWKALPVDIGA
jgi:hypothetical protein